MTSGVLLLSDLLLLLLLALLLPHLGLGGLNSLVEELDLLLHLLTPILHFFEELQHVLPQGLDLLGLHCDLGPQLSYVALQRPGVDASGSRALLRLIVSICYGY